jgi:beta-lactamase regulating signal transducer with metallopeptidase domain
MIELLMDSMLRDWTDSLVAGLAVFALRASVLLLTAWAVTRLMRQASAATRHLVWTSAIAGILVLPLLGAVVPAWTVPVITIRAAVDAPLLDDPSPATNPIAVAAEPRLPDKAPIQPAPIARAEQPSTSDFVAPSIRMTPAGVFVAAWLTLAFLFLARLAIANARVSAWRRSSRLVSDPRMLMLLQDLTTEYGIERPVVLLESQETDVPVTWGVVYPVILVPTAFAQWDEEQRIAVLTHELAHVKRFDAFTQQLAQIALALLWFHPLVWVAVRRMRLEREHACDDFVLASGTRASRYADDLLGLARRLTRPTVPAAAALAMARRSELEGRLLAILDPATRRSSVRRARVALLTVAMLGLATSITAFRPGARVVTTPARSERAGMAPAVAPSPTPAPTPGVVLERPSRFAQLDSNQSVALAGLSRRIGVLPAQESASSGLLAQLRARPDTEPPLRPIDIGTLVGVTRAAKRMTSDHEKGQLLKSVALRYVRNDSLRDAYIDVTASMTSDHERAQALIALLDRDSLPNDATLEVLRATRTMTSDMNRSQVLRRIGPATFADTAVQRAFLGVITSMTSDMERARSLGALVKQTPLAPASQMALLRNTTAISSNTDKANVLLLFLEKQGIADPAVKREFFRVAESFTSDSEYRRVMMAVMK